MYKEVGWGEVEESRLALVIPGMFASRVLVTVSLKRRYFMPTILYVAERFSHSVFTNKNARTTPRLFCLSLPHHDRLCPPLYYHVARGRARLPATVYHPAGKTFPAATGALPGVQQSADTGAALLP